MSIRITPMTKNSPLYALAAELEKSRIVLARTLPADALSLAAHETDTLTAALSASAHARDLRNLRLRRDHLLGECTALRREEAFAAQELTRIRSAPLAVGQFGEMVDDRHAVVHANSGQSYFVRVMSTLPREELRPNAPVALHRHSSAVVKTLPPHVDAAVSAVAMTRRPEVSFRDIGGLEEQKRELREAVELPLTHGELFRAVGVEPPRGVLLYGPPGTGKTMMAKAVAESSRAAFINVVGSEFVQKYIGEGARMVRNVFQMAKESAEKDGRGAIIFIDEIDAIGMARHDSTVSSDREVQRIMLELLNQMDGFDQNTNVKVIMATNRPDTLDPALMRPGRLDRKIEFPLPDRRQRRLVFATATAKMQLAPEVQLEDFVRRPERLNSAEIASICSEAGLRAIRANRYMISTKDFEEAYEAVVKRTDKGHDFYS